ncbi:phage minor head protein [Xenorhabdus ehlersii]|uniref:Phage head morphogenesis protein n=1 Tax=Xenorhabdus ehlersii TaxID=290111 RepID=A0A2D0IS30_9GAMM|nr:phage minor head protein [Xenorhabdus ehlersii]PHM24592.1 phage head morphogenesis protein [Xenorhabdus ehlersii]RKE91231.1 SPP1 gp7 family putative phage head morphogenesis protein [Xenorhabdus ehlersii]
MSMTTAELAYCMTLPPKRAIGYLKSKGYQISWDWEDLWQDAHARSFTVAKVTRLDILEDIRQVLQQALDEGKTDRWFRKELETVLKRKGWWGTTEADDPVTGERVTVQQGSPWRLDTIFRTNMSVLYSAGRWAEQMENIDDRPYWMYTGINDSHTRKSHLALHGLVFRYDDPFWQAFYPPNGWRCRCSVIALSYDDVKARGLKVANSGKAMGSELKLISQKTGEMQPVATFITGTTQTGKTKVATDVGWSYSPGAAYHPDLARYQGSLFGLARRELRGQNE